MPPMQLAHQQSADAVLAALASDAQRGLSTAEAQGRLARDGPNAIASAPGIPTWRRVAAQFRSVLVLLLLVATAVSAGLWAYERDTPLPYEAIAILAIVLLNAALGFVMEARAASAVAALRAMSAANASVMRDGERRLVPAPEIVAGDVILVEEGDTIPADARLISSTALQAAEAALTGESQPVTKVVDVVSGDVAIGDRANMVFSGTVATYGRGTAVVTATGMRTEMGRIAELLEATEHETTPLQQELDRTGRVLGTIVVIIAIVMVGTIILLEDVRGFAAFAEVLILGVALAVAAVPEGLPAVVTAVLALGVQRMARRRAIVRNLAAVETLGSATVIASDKTGTLTKNEMTVRVVATAAGRVHFSGAGYAPEGDVRSDPDGDVGGALRTELDRALTAGERANNASLNQRDGHWVVNGDPTEGALLAAARKAGLDVNALDTRLPRVGEVPFSSERKLMSTVHADAAQDGRLVVFTKGAADVLLTRCSHELVGATEMPLTPERSAEILRTSNGIAGEALRTLGVASRLLPPDAIAAAVSETIERDLVFLGLIGMIDPPRAEATAAVRKAQDAGIRLLMITGDHPETAAVIAQELGISTDKRVVTGPELSAMTDEVLDHTAREVSVYARVNPEHKLRIVGALQRGGAVVAMTGDGVNDAPALKMADIGVAMGVTGSDVSKDAADIVLADDNFATIVAAVEEGRAVYANIRRFLRFLLSSNLGEVLTMFFGVLLGDRIGLLSDGNSVALPLLASQILWINLVTDGAPAFALGVDPHDEGVMRRPPRPRGERVVTLRMWRGIVLVGVVMAVGTLYVLDASLPGGFVNGSGEMAHARTMAFTTLMLFQLFNVFNARSDTRSAFVGLFQNAWLWGAIASSLALQVAVTYVPFLQNVFGTVALNGPDWLFSTAIASSVLWVRELSKLAMRQMR